MNNKQKRNSLCSCGSGVKYKKCCGAINKKTHWKRYFTIASACIIAFATIGLIFIESKDQLITKNEEVVIDLKVKHQRGIAELLRVKQIKEYTRIYNSFYSMLEGLNVRKAVLDGQKRIIIQSYVEPIYALSGMEKEEEIPQKQIDEWEAIANPEKYQEIQKQLFLKTTKMLNKQNDDIKEKEKRINKLKKERASAIRFYASLNAMGLILAAFASIFKDNK